MKTSSKKSLIEGVNIFLAHSAQQDKNILPQSYKDHVKNVNHLGDNFFSQMISFYLDPKNCIMPQSMKKTLLSSTLYHDLGKLDVSFQQILKGMKNGSNKIQHEHAGTVALLEKGAFEAAGLVTAHHQGLIFYQKARSDEEPIQIEEWGKASFIKKYNEYTKKTTEKNLSDYLSIHQKEVGKYSVQADNSCLKQLTGFQRRLLLSCLVDADHSDTARNYHNEPKIKTPKTKWEERINALDIYVRNLPRPSKKAEDKEKQRQIIRDRLYEQCSTFSGKEQLVYCDSIVGSGKTTSIMAHLLRVAQDRKLRHIIIVLPYTNIIKQSVKIYRDALCLQGENPEEIVAEHHHQADFETEDIRYLSTLWHAPIIVTTAVQFFETLSANNPKRLRKLHELPGSAVCLDEAHNALPYQLWPLAWIWLSEWTTKWKGYLVLSSGSLPPFWQNENFIQIINNSFSSNHISIKSLTNDEFTNDLNEAERLRVKYETEKKPLSESDLIEKIVMARSPRLVVVNTILSATKLAHKLNEKHKLKVLHLSTALAPIHRDNILEQIKELLRSPEENWVLVATNLVEAGMDFSFASGFRQRSSIASLIQLSGRINRHATQKDIATILDFTFEDIVEYPDNPALEYSQRALQEIFDKNMLSSKSNLKEIFLLSMESEFKRGAQQKAIHLIQHENNNNYPEVSKLFNVIDNDTVTVVIDQEISVLLRNKEKVDPKKVQKHSVQISSSKIKLYNLIPIYEQELYCLNENWKYDPNFLGYMEEVIQNNSYQITNGSYY